LSQRLHAANRLLGILNLEAEKTISVEAASGAARGNWGRLPFLDEFGKIRQAYVISG